MKKTLVRILSFLLLICLAVTLLPSCKEDTEQNTEIPAPITYTSIIENKKSDYVIVHSATDTVGKTLANELCSLLYKNYGVSLPIRSDQSTYEKEIVVGCANRESARAAEAMLKDGSDFYIGNDNGTVVLYAKEPSAMKHLLITLRDGFCKQQTEKFALADNESYLYSEHTDVAYTGATAELLKKGVTDYAIVINEDQLDVERVARYVQSALLLQGANVKIYEDFEDYAENKAHEIILGFASIDRPEIKGLQNSLMGDGDFLLTCVDEKVVLLGSDVNGLIRGAEYLVSQKINKAENGNITLREWDEYRHNLSGQSFTVSNSKLSELYETVLKRYPTLYDYYFRTGTVSNDSKRDQQLIEALIERMDNAAVFRIGSSSVLYNGMIRKLDPQKYSRVALLTDGTVYIPTDFANVYFGTSFDTAGYKVVSLNALAEQTGSTVYHDSQTGLVILTPPNVTSFAEDSYMSGGYNNKAYRERMLKFFTSEEMPDPSNNTEQSRVVIDTSENYFPETSYDYTQVTYTVCYSPSILTRKDASGNTVLYASYELTNIKEGAELSTTTVIQTSTDGGSTWKEFAKIPSLRWAELFEVGDTLYLIGSMIGKNDTTICKINANGTYTSQKLFDRHIAITQPLIAGGIIYVAADFGMISASTTADLTDPASWTRSNNPQELVNREWFMRITGKPLANPAAGLGGCNLMEGNVVQGPDGGIYAIYRIESHPHGDYAVMLKLSADRKTLELLPNDGSLINLPTTVSRFTIKYDSKTKLYILVSNLWTVEDCDRARNVVGLSVSADLRTWRTVDTLLVDREMMNAEASCWAHAFQYTDFDFDGDDLVLCVREATGFTNTFHDGKYCTFYRVSDFRDLI